MEGGEPSPVIRERMEAARMLQEQRFAGLGKLNLPVTGDMGSAEVQQFCRVDEQGKCLLRRAAQQMGLSARAYHCVTHFVS